MDGTGAGADRCAAGRAGGGAESAHKGRRVRANAGRRLGLLSPVCRGGQYPLLCRKPTEDADVAREEVLLDGDAEAEGGLLFGRQRRIRRSPDVCYCHRQQRVEYCKIGIRDLEQAICWLTN